MDNWSGVVLWENADRFCSHGLPTVECTLVDPSRITASSCAAGLGDASKASESYVNPNYFKDCRWLTKNVKIHDNTFQLDPARVSDCSVDKACGVNGVFANYGVTSPYDNSTVATNITFNQGNTFYNNSYQGPWHFMGWAQSNTDYPLTFSTWQDPATDKCTGSDEIASGSCDSGFGQDAGSTYG